MSSDEEELSCTDSEDEIEVEIENKPVYKKISKEEVVLPNLTSDGIVDEKIAKKFPKDILRQCEFCHKYFDKKDMMITMSAENTVCLHCYFWINYDEGLRQLADGQFGIKIVDYILKCSKDHVMDQCQRKTDAGGCFLCEYQLGIKITNIRDPEKIYPDSKKKADNVRKQPSVKIKIKI
jgi:hypothetical protein